MPGAFDGASQLALLALGQAGFLAGFYLSVLVHIALQGLEILVVKKGYVGPVLKYLCHSFSLKGDVIEVDRLVADVFDHNIFVFLA